MFHWICPECGREIAPQAKECTACEAAAPVAVQPTLANRPERLLEAATEPTPGPVQPRAEGAPKLPAPASPRPTAAAVRDLAPVPPAPASAEHPAWHRALPDLEPARAPQVASAPLRDPHPTAPFGPHVAQVPSGPEPSVARTKLPELSHPTPAAPPLAGLADYAKLAAERIRPAMGTSKPSGSAVKEQLSLPGPTLPHELTSLHAAGIARILVPAGRVVAAHKSSWALSLVVAAAVLAGTLGAAFYAMPSLASAPPPPQTSEMPPQAKVLPEAVTGACQRL